ncbi:hypothetical protein CLV44_11775 [Marinobacterium halophilum]|uniref:DUF4157 domain-containing protein n=1 Tax=Marinobacterium halophilum TaxID=267374 RepID=A0A2P8EST6_9GAMM|nr:hypothetical protein [Marinobacterium halophilum]PSL12546.1 hypothetical protein CLV44_11775 [Marinobacterium halophilum]
MIEEIGEWIHQVNSLHKEVRRPCSVLAEHFNGFYSPDFLKTAFFVVTDEIPKPDFPELREAGLGDFIDMNVGGITYNDTYYVKKEVANELRLHFHELVHVLQWRELGPQGFIERYIREIQDFGYDNAPLEKMAYALDGHYQSKGRHLSVERFVRENV